MFEKGNKYAYWTMKWWWNETHNLPYSSMILLLYFLICTSFCLRLRPSINENIYSILTDAFEMWCWRRMLWIPWTAKRTNESILSELKIKTRLSSIIEQRFNCYFGHIMRKSGENLERLLGIMKARDHVADHQCDGPLSQIPRGGDVRNGSQSMAGMHLRS